MRVKRLLSACVLAIGMAGTSAAQELGTVISPILVIEQDRLFNESKFGQALQQEFTRQRQLFLEENARLIEALDAEEAELTEQRKTMAPEAFKILADEFDARTQDIRDARDAKQVELGRLFEQLRVNFINSLSPFLGVIMAERRAAVVLNDDQVFYRLNAIVITDDVIAIMDAEFDRRAAARENISKDETSNTGE